MIHVCRASEHTGRAIEKELEVNFPGGGKKKEKTRLQTKQTNGKYFGTNPTTL